MVQDFMRGSTDGIERALDAALAMTFPASDPVAISVPSRLNACAAYPLIAAKKPIALPGTTALLASAR
jgi:hypothetical protein